MKSAPVSCRPRGPRSRLTIATAGRHTPLREFRWIPVMQIVDHEDLEREQWRPGVLTRTRISARTGAAQLCVFEQWCDSGCGAPTHLHTVEEVLTVLAGNVEIWLGEDRATLTAGQSVIVPAGQRHGFRNIGGTTLHMEAILAAPMFDPVTRRD
jgi:mannose-6-phosphate isomerase-like protein (cupin superfamily)